MRYYYKPDTEYRGVIAPPILDYEKVGEANASPTVLKAMFFSSVYYLSMVWIAHSWSNPEPLALVMT